MPWSSPLPPAEMAAALSIGHLFEPIAAIALVSLLAGFAVLLAGIVEDLRKDRPLELTPGQARPGAAHHAKTSRAA